LGRENQYGNDGDGSVAWLRHGKGLLQQRDMSSTVGAQTLSSTFT